MAKLFSKDLNTHQKKPVSTAFKQGRNMAMFNRIKKIRMKRGTKQTWNQAQDNLATIKDFAQSTLKTSKIVAQDALVNIQENASQGLDRAQHLMATVIGITGAAVAIFYKNRQQAQEKLQRTQMSLMASTTPIVERTQKAVRANTQKATHGLQQAKSTAKDFTIFVQDQYTHLQTKRRRRRALFRIGLIAGAILALLYTPLSGAEIRQRLNAQWQQYRGYIGI